MTVGISAIGQLLPLLDYVDMDGAAIIGSGYCYRLCSPTRCLPLSDVPGNGVTLIKQIFSQITQFWLLSYWLVW